MGHNPNAGDALLRQWAILKKIPQYPQKVTATELLHHLEREGFKISKRTVERNLNELSLIFPIFKEEKSRPYGWSWNKEAKLFAFPTMSPIQALTLCLARDHLANLLPANLLKQLQPYFGYANNILLSGKLVKNIEQWRRKVAIIPSTQPLITPHYTKEILDTVHQALMEEKQLQVRYASRTSRKSENHVLHPLGLVQRGPVIYLLTTFNQYKDIRMLALHRIRSAVMLEDTAVIPKDFSLKDYIDSGAFGFHASGNMTLVVRFTNHVAEHLQETPLSQDQQFIQEGDYVRITATVSNNAQLRWWLRGFGADAEVIKPDFLRKEFAANARELAVLYGKSKLKKG